MVPTALPASVVPALARWTYDVGTRSWRWSTTMLRLLDAGLAGSDDVSGLLGRAHPDDRAAVQAEFSRALAEHTPLSGTVRLRTDSRGERTFAFAGEPVALADGALASMWGVTFDVTAQVSARCREAVLAATSSRACIDQVKGMLMYRCGITDDAAFEILRRFSTTHNVRLALLAERTAAHVAATGHSRPDREPEQLLRRAAEELVRERVTGS